MDAVKVKVISQDADFYLLTALIEFINRLVISGLCGPVNTVKHHQCYIFVSGKMWLFLMLIKLGSW